MVMFFLILALVFVVLLVIITNIVIVPGAHHRGAAGFRQAHGGEPHGLYHRGGGERA